LTFRPSSLSSFSFASPHRDLIVSTRYPSDSRLALSKFPQSSPTTLLKMTIYSLQQRLGIPLEVYSLVLGPDGIVDLEVMSGNQAKRALGYTTPRAPRYPPLRTFPISIGTLLSVLPAVYHQKRLSSCKQPPMKRRARGQMNTRMGPTPIQMSKPIPGSSARKTVSQTVRPSPSLPSSTYPCRDRQIGLHHRRASASTEVSMFWLLSKTCRLPRRSGRW
jgi:hypothetical protein